MQQPRVVPLNQPYVVRLSADERDLISVALQTVALQKQGSGQLPLANVLTALADRVAQARLG